MPVRFFLLFHRNNCMLGLKTNKLGRIQSVLVMYSVEATGPSKKKNVRIRDHVTKFVRE